MSQLCNHDLNRKTAQRKETVPSEPDLMLSLVAVTLTHYLDLIHLQLPLDATVLPLQARQACLDVLVGGDEGEVGG